MSENRLELQIKNFGPVSEATIKIKPLTIFIGKNNTGKSYIATLIYSICRANRLSIRYKERYTKLYNIENYVKNSLIMQIERNFKSNFDELITKKRSYTSIFVKSSNNIEYTLKISKTDKKVGPDGLFDSGILPPGAKFSYTFEREGKYMYYCSLHPFAIGEIIVSDSFNNKNINDKNIVRIPEGSSLADCRFNIDSDKCFDPGILKVKKGTTVTWINDDNTSHTVTSGLSYGLPPSYLYSELQFGHNIGANILEKLEFFANEIILPSSRSGLLQIRKILASNLIEDELTSIDISKKIPISGLIADFISLLLKLEQYEENSPDTSNKILASMEGILNGKFMFKNSSFIFQDKLHDLELEVIKSSSGIQELTPFYFIVKHVTDTNTLLVIEEPEAHLHPELIEQLARILVLLVRHGFYIIITTHNDFLLEKLNILLKLSNIKEEDRERLGYNLQEYLKQDEVSAYLFRYSEEHKSNIVEELSIDKEGIPEDEFSKIVNELRNEYVRVELYESK